MNNLPENQNNLTESELESTIFSDPTEHKKVEPRRSGKVRIRIIIASLLAVALLASVTFAVVKFIPEKQDEVTSSTPQITVSKIESKDVKAVEVKNKSGKYMLLPYEVKGESETTVSWYLDGLKKEFVSSSVLEDIVNNAVALNAVREITTKTDEECGLNAPQIEVKVSLKDNKDIVLSLGAKSPDNSGFYLKNSANDKVYLVEQDIFDSFDFEKLDLANTDSIPPIKLSSKYDSYFADGSLVSFDKLTISSKNFKDTIVLAPNTDKNLSQFVQFVVVKPNYRMAGNTESIFAMFAQGINSIGAYAFDVSNATLEALGLNRPDFALTVEIGESKVEYKFKMQDDGCYAVIGNGSEIVKKVEPSTCAFLDYQEMDFYSNIVFMKSIDDLANITIESSGKKYSFDIKANDEVNSEDQFIIEHNGKKIKSIYFQNFYQTLISLTYSEHLVDELNAPDEVIITYNYNNKKVTPTKVSFKKVSATRHQYYIDGKPMGKVNTAELNKVLKNLENVVAGKDVSTN